MLNQWAQRLTSTLFYHTQIDNSRRTTFIYGFELLLSTSLSIFSIIIISAFLSCLSHAIIFLVVFISLRLFNGGFHAKTYRRCFLLTNAVYLTVLAASVYAYKSVPASTYCPIYILGTLLSTGAIVYLSPIKHFNHPLSENRYRKNQKIGRRLVLIYSVVNCFLLFLSIKAVYSVLISFTLMAVAIMMIIPQFTERRD